ncbi:MAG: hypothetical protein MJ070_06830 [Lachnospiraceae bacterium]|nr:hypothetical protein [Lachnospiraceae bacterium]
MKRTKPFFWFLLLFAVGCFIGFLSISMIPESFFEDPFSLLVLILLWPVAALPTLLHEAGHLVFGLISGYRFVSFRVGSLTLVRGKGKLFFVRRKLQGTGGQCLMSPPDRAEHPVLLYMYGGVIFNFISFVIALVVFLLTDIVTLRILLAFFGFVSLFSAIINGIPVKPFGIPNDGFNAKQLSRDPVVRRAVDLQLLINEAAENGITIDQMPKEWFDLPPKEALTDPQVIATLIYRGSYLGACGDNDGMADVFRYALSLPDLLPIHRLSVKAGLFNYIILYQNADPLQLSGTDFSELLHYIGMRGNPDVSTAAYAYHALVRGDLDSAHDAWNDFDRVIRNYPEGLRITAQRDMAEIQNKVRSVFGQV